MTKQQTPLEQRATALTSRISRLGIPKSELSKRADIDRGTLSRAEKADPRITERTWTRIELVLSRLEEEIGIEVRDAREVVGVTTASGESVTSTVEYQGATITMSGKADAVAEAIRRVLDGDS